MHHIWIAVNIWRHTTSKVPRMASVNGRETSHRDCDAYARTIQWHTIKHAQDIPSSSYVNLGCAVGYEHGPHIVRLWKLWLPRLIGTGRENYAVLLMYSLMSALIYFKYSPLNVNVEEQFETLKMIWSISYLLLEKKYTERDLVLVFLVFVSCVQIQQLTISAKKLST